MKLKLKRVNLVLFTGFIWLWAGFALLHRAYTWISLLTENQLLISIVIGLILAFIKIYFIFYKLTTSNIQRIYNFIDENVSILKFHLVKDQILIVLMILFGSLLRNAPFIPKVFLMPIYLGIGLAMLYSASLYFMFFINNYKSGLKAKN
ncbi:MAG: hypothetical protein B6I20_12850 [Bacteroidetes bacterium 4572_117]|nr:MAG: hypothetical protein B6I20_12850 [Bacteroidetes bacterium 4572_117]